MELTEKQKKFCEEYLVDLNATQAAIRAGYSKDTAKQMGCENLAKPYLAEYITQLRSVQSEKAGVTVQYILEGLKEIVERSMQRVPVMVRQGKHMVQKVDEETGEGVWEFDAAAANKSFELLGKHIGFFEVDNSQKKPDTAPIQIYLPDNKRDEPEKK